MRSFSFFNNKPRSGDRVGLLCCFKADAREFISIANKLLTDDDALTNDEVTAYANILKSLRAESTKEENISTKGLLGGDKSAIIKITFPSYKNFLL